MEELPIFRANKRRKFAREKAIKLPISPGDTQDQEVPDNEASHSDDETNVSSLIKLRNQNRSRNVGVRFSQDKRAEEDGALDNLALTKVDPDEERLRDISNRFVGGTGQVVDVDKHMFVSSLLNTHPRFGVY